jgi:hypothetical protein
MALWSMPLLQAPGKSLDPLFLIANPQGQAQYALRCQHCDELCALLPTMAETIYQHWHGKT